MKLPFVVQPKRASVIERVGNEQIGILEIERKGYLTTGEMAFVQHQAAEDTSTEKVLLLVRKVANQFKIDSQKAYEIVTQSITGGGKSTAVSRKVEEIFAEDIAAIVQALMNQQQQKRLLCAYALIVYRVAEDFTIEELMELDPILIDEIYALYEKEENRVLSDLSDKTSDDVLEQASDLETLEKK